MAFGNMREYFIEKGHIFIPFFQLHLTKVRIVIEGQRGTTRFNKEVSEYAFRLLYPLLFPATTCPLPCILTFSKMCNTKKV